MSSTIKLDISGMTCNHCVMHTRKALEAIPGVSAVEVNLEPGGAVVEAEGVDAQTLIAAVKEAGYDAVIAQ